LIKQADLGDWIIEENLFFYFAFKPAMHFTAFQPDCVIVKKFLKYLWNNQSIK